MYMLFVRANILCNYYPCIVAILSLRGKYRSHLVFMLLFRGFVVYKIILCVVVHLFIARPDSSVSNQTFWSRFFCLNQLRSLLLLDYAIRDAASFLVNILK